MAFEDTLDDYEAIEDGKPLAPTTLPQRPTTYKELTLDDFKPVELAASGKPVRQRAMSRRRGRPAKAKLPEVPTFGGLTERLMTRPEMRSVPKALSDRMSSDYERAKIAGEVKAQRLKEEQEALANAPWYERTGAR